MKAGFADPVLRRRIVVELAAVGLRCIRDIESFDGAVVADVYGVLVIDRYCGRTESLV